ncbi:MAG TPA: VanZ family protein [Desulfobulbus sp.]|nr:VanZ family protein [Desulfobulbus sp.]
MIRSRSWWRLLPLLTVMAVIFFLSHQPGDSFELPDLPDIDKLLHSLVYGVLAATALFAVPSACTSRRPWLTMVLVVLFCLAYGTSDEFHQSFVPGRTPSAWDLAADTLGAVLVCAGWYLLGRQGRRGRQGWVRHVR